MKSLHYLRKKNYRKVYFLKNAIILHIEIFFLFLSPFLEFHDEYMCCILKITNSPENPKIRKRHGPGFSKRPDFRNISNVRCIKDQLSTKKKKTRDIFLFNTMNLFYT